MSPDQRAQATAERQNGYLTWEQARACGLSEGQISQRRMSGGWVRILPTVYRMPAVPDTYEGRLMAVGLWMGTNGHLYGRTAAHVLRLDGISKPSVIEVARYQGMKTPTWLKVRRLRPHDRPKVRNVAGHRVPVVERVLVDLAAGIPPREVGLALDDAMRRGMTTIDRLKRLLDSCGKGTRGAVVLRKLVTGRDINDERVRSIFETKMLRILRRIKGLEIVADHRVVVDGHTIIMDFYLPVGSLDIECHSFRWHHGSEGNNRDAKRHRRLASVGIEVLYFTWDEVTFGANEVEKEVRRALARRRALLSSLRGSRQTRVTKKGKG